MRHFGHLNRTVNIAELLPINEEGRILLHGRRGARYGA
jgi:hypothetical protein